MRCVLKKLPFSAMAARITSRANGSLETWRQDHAQRCTGRPSRGGVALGIRPPIDQPVIPSTRVLHPPNIPGTENDSTPFSAALRFPLVPGPRAASVVCSARDRPRHHARQIPSRSSRRRPPSPDAKPLARANPRMNPAAAVVRMCLAAVRSDLLCDLRQPVGIGEDQVRARAASRVVCEADRHHRRIQLPTVRHDLVEERTARRVLRISWKYTNGRERAKDVARHPIKIGRTGGERGLLRHGSARRSIRVDRIAQHLATHSSAASPRR